MMDSLFKKNIDGHLIVCFFAFFISALAFVACSDSSSTVILDDNDSAADLNDSACTTQELKDKSGVKIICNGDSIGVVLYGKDGKDGKDGADGKSAYELSGFDGTFAEWLESLKGADGKSCKTKEVADGIQVTCGDEDPVLIKNGKDGKPGEGCIVSNTEASMKIVCGSDSVNVSLTGADGKTRYICADAECSSWREATDIEKDTMGWGHDFKEGAVRNGRINTNYTYVYENKNWRLGTKLDSLLVEAGGSACMNVGDTSKVKYDKVYYVCTADVDNAIRGWVNAPDLYNDTYESRGECKAKGKFGDGTILAGRVNTDKKYVCDGDTFRLAAKIETSGNKGCTSYNRDILLILANQYSYYKCTKEGWSFTLEKLNTGTIKDARDNQVYKTIGVKEQMWMAENLKIDYKLPKTKDADAIYQGNVCYEDDCDIYGRYYTWAMAMDSAGLYSKNGKGCGYGAVCAPTYPVRGICPEGWHLPTADELRNLYCSMDGTVEALQSKGYNEWPRATDKYGISVLPGGVAYKGEFSHVGRNAYFWSSSFERATLADSVTADVFFMYPNTIGVMDGNSVRQAMTVRCVKD